MDFERLGHTMGANDALRIMTDAAEAQILKAHAEIHKANSEILQGNAEIERLSNVIGNLETKLAVETMHAAGLLAQVRALKAELVKVAPNHPIFTKTGKAYVSGPQTKLGVSYDEGFDAKGRELGIPDFAKYRKIAK